MSAIRQALTEYLAMRRALGYKLEKTERLLGQFVSFVEDRGEKCLTTETALAWATLPAGADASWTSRRLAEVRIFARHLHGIDPATQVPSMGTRLRRSQAIKFNQQPPWVGPSPTGDLRLEAHDETPFSKRCSRAL